MEDYILRNKKYNTSTLKNSDLVDMVIILKVSKKGIKNTSDKEFIDADRVPS